MTVTVEIEQVIGDVHRRRTKTECQKGQYQRAGHASIGHDMRGHRGDEEQQIFCPLMQAQYPTDVCKTHAVSGKDLLDVGHSACLLLYRYRCVNDNRTPRTLPDRQISRRIARIIKTIATKARFQCSALVFGAQIMVTIAGHDFIKNTEVFSHSIC